MQKMPWLKTRLREIGRTPASLARHLKIGGPRVYEMIGGRRGMQPDEIEQTATFLDWSVEELLKHLPEEARIVPAQMGNGVPVLGTTRQSDCKRCDARLTGATTRFVETLPAWQGRSDIQCLYMASAAMRPWRAAGELVVFETNRPPAEYDYVVIYLQAADNDQTPVMVRQLIELKTTKLRVRQHNPPRGQKRESDIDLKSIAFIYRVMTWDDCVR